LINNRYQKVKRIGEGSYGTVFLAVDMRPDGKSRTVDQKYLNLIPKLESAKATDGFSEFNDDCTQAEKDEI
jgi:serine/threonine protein kinase